MKKITLIALFSGILLNASSIQAQTNKLTIKAKPANSSFAYVESSPGGASVCYKGTSIVVADWTVSGVPYVWRAFMKIDMAPLTANKIIDSAFLDLYANPTSPSGNPGNPTWGTANATSINRVTSAWDTVSLTWGTQPSYTTNNSVTLPQSTGTAQDYLHVDVSGLVQDMLTFGNKGLLLRHVQETTPLNSMIFYSPNAFATDSTKVPKLVIYYHSPVNVSSVNTNNLTVDMYPNPATSQVNITVVKEAGEQVSVTILDCTGRVITNETNNDQSPKISMSISLDGYVPGIYMVRLQDGKGNAVTRKLMIH